jgi:hypothetical protein
MSKIYTLTGTALMEKIQHLRMRLVANGAQMLNSKALLEIIVTSDPWHFNIFLRMH